MSDLVLETSVIPGLLVLRLPVHHDARGWFKENWQRQKMNALGLPDFGPVQQNISFNNARGVTRGIHAEPWDKLVSVVSGRAFGAWVDLREGDSFGTTFHLEMDPGVAVFVPRGVGNAYQVLEDGTVYGYLVNEHWRPGVEYPAINLGDPAASVPWPIPLERAEISEKDTRTPRLADVRPMPRRKTLLLGAGGQLGTALRDAFPSAVAVDHATLDIADPEQVTAWPWGDYELVLNAAAYTAVDAAETDDGRRAAWATNAVGPVHLARVARAHRLTLVHYSTDYVFDGAAEVHAEDEPPSPLGVYGQSKAAGDLAVKECPRHYLLRTSWVVGRGRNFVRTMLRLALDGTSPEVVSDQLGRLTFADELARATRHLVHVRATYGTYNVTNGGETRSWADIARQVFERAGRDPDDVRPTTTEAFSTSRQVAPRPRHSTLDLSKLEATGHRPASGDVALMDYLDRALDNS